MDFSIFGLWLEATHLSLLGWSAAWTINYRLFSLIRGCGFYAAFLGSCAECLPFSPPCSYLRIIIHQFKDTLVSHEQVGTCAIEAGQLLRSCGNVRIGGQAPCRTQRGGGGGGILWFCSYMNSSSCSPDYECRFTE